MISQQLPTIEFDKEVPDMLRDVVAAAHRAHDMIMDLSEVQQERAPDFLLFMTSDDRKGTLSFGVASSGARARIIVTVFNSLPRSAQQATLTFLLTELKA